MKNDSNRSKNKIRPVVCCVEDHYVICIPTRTQHIIYVQCGNREFTCNDNGVIKTDLLVQKFTVPKTLLDASGGYTVRFAKMLNRKPYRSEISPFTECSFPFTPVPDRYPIRITHISDTHGEGKAAVSAAAYFPKTDLLILNGDISSSSNNKKDVLLPFEIAYAVTKGESPCIITRGNHDLRGKIAEKLSEIYPTDQGRMYYTVSTDTVRFLVLDCGEDKDDTHAEYGGTAAFHDYRLQESAFISTVADNRAFTDSSVPIIVLSHIPFMHTDDGEFAIEQSVYAQWCRVIRDRMHPAFGLFGHHHRTVCYQTGDPFDTKGIGCPIVLGGKPLSRPTGKTVVCACITLCRHQADVVFVDGDRTVTDSDAIRF